MTPTLKLTDLSNADGHRATELAALLRDWESRGRPPMIVGGDFNQLASGPNYRTMTRSFNDALWKLSQIGWTCEHGLLKTRIDYLLTTKDWKPTAGGVINSDASDHRPIWVEVSRRTD